MQYLKLIWLAIVHFWRATLSDHEETFVQFELLQRMIEDSDFSDPLVRRKFWAFCRLKPTREYKSQVFSALEHQRPRLFVSLARSLSAGAA
jgi:hypothetical protein